MPCRATNQITAGLVQTWPRTCRGPKAPMITHSLGPSSGPVLQITNRTGSKYPLVRFSGWPSVRKVPDYGGADPHEPIRDCVCLGASLRNPLTRSDPADSPLIASSWATYLVLVKSYIDVVPRRAAFPSLTAQSPVPFSQGCTP